MNSFPPKEILCHAFNKTPYYRELFKRHNIDINSINSKEEYRKIPFLTKQIIQQEKHNLLESDYSDEESRKSLIIQRTSGSTGKILKTYWKKNDSIRSLYYLWNIRRRYNILPNDKLLSFHSAIYHKDKVIKPKLYMFNHGNHLSLCKMNLTDEIITQFHSEIEAFQPKWIMAQPSTVYLFSQFFKKNKLPVYDSLRYIELTGEYLSNSIRAEISDIFKVPISNQYGCMEANSIACECSKGQLHVMTKNVYIEIMNNEMPAEEGETGEIIISCLTNSVMPIIRYKIGDKGKLIHQHGCSCGNTNPIIELKTGRIGENIYIKGKAPISSFLFHYITENININYNNCILHFHVTQENDKDFTVRLVLTDDTPQLRQKVEELFRAEIIEQGLGSMKWIFMFCKDIVTNKISGKLQFFTNKYKETIE
ncbi:MAG: phenylacetate--CoA ligase family protein [Spirochaetales bacterium]|nr:phenylacetate--CoA ligase family protein [Spirochaetales bacterium]